MSLGSYNEIMTISIICSELLLFLFFVVVVVVATNLV